ncbi:MAG: sulfite exporter TauE/SafE family protein [Candidatus Bathyarchaeota archaeon]|nr:sulfite exporter TauE/SafE family protein [Candidatus Bathyarchaeota archaeon]
MDPTILLPLIAFFVGIIAAMIGVGGGVFIVPVLCLIFNIEPRVAFGTSLATIIFTSLSSTMNYSRQKRIDYRVGLVLGAATIPGAFIGAYLTSVIESRLLGLIFGFFLVFVALRMTTKFGFFKFGFPRKRDSWHRMIVGSDGNIFEYDINIGLGLALSFFGGLSSGLLGIGGGSVMVPIMCLVMNMPMHVAVATSMFIMIFTSISGVVTHISFGNVLFEYVVLLSIGVIFGAQLGAYYSKRISAKNLRRIFGVVLLLVSVRMILKYV